MLTFWGRRAKKIPVRAGIMNAELALLRGGRHGLISLPLKQRF